MKAIVQSEYGRSAEVLQLQDIEKPVVTDDAVLVRVRAAGIHAGDWHLVRGLPYLIRMMGYGLLKPKKKVPGSDLAGVVEAVGDDVTQFVPGDEVFGSGSAAFAEYASAREGNLVLKPANLTFEQAATIAASGLTALQGLRDHGEVQEGQKVLINGASGGVGHFAVQIAKAFGADVTGVCSTRNVEMVGSIGADQVIDYTGEDFTLGGPRFDMILDMIGNHSLSALRRVLVPKGTLVVVGSSGGPLLQGAGRLARAPLLSRFVSQTLRAFVAKVNKDDLVTLKRLIEDGKVAPVIDRTHPLREAPGAIGYVEEGHVRGKVVITM